jgi:rhamnosyltransferase
VSNVGVIVPTLNAGALLDACLGPVLCSRIRPRIRRRLPSRRTIRSTAPRPGAADNRGCPVTALITGARGDGRRSIDMPIVVMMTQDARPLTPESLRRLIAPVEDGTAAAAYGRQLPRPGAGPIEAFRRGFSYPPVSHLRRLGGPADRLPLRTRSRPSRHPRYWPTSVRPPRHSP